MKTETITCDICKKEMDKTGITVELYAGSTEPEYCLPHGQIRIDVCVVCLGKFGIKKEKVDVEKIEDLIRGIAYDEAMDVHDGG